MKARSHSGRRGVARFHQSSKGANPWTRTREGNQKFSRRSFLKKSLLGTGALALSQLPFARTVHAATGPVSLTYWHGWTGEWEKMVQSVVDMYHAKQSKVRINPVVVPWDQFIPKLTAAIAAGNPPDVVTLFSTAAIPTLAAQQAILSLDDIAGVDLAAAQEWFDPEHLFPRAIQAEDLWAFVLGWELLPPFQQRAFKGGRFGS